MKSDRAGQRMLLLSDDSSSEFEQKQINKNNSIQLQVLKQKQQDQQPNQESITPQIQQQIQNFIRKSQLKKCNKKADAQDNKHGEHFQDKKQLIQRQENGTIMSQTQSMNIKTMQSQTLKLDIKKYQYKFPMQDSDKAKKNLKSFSLQSYVAKKKIVDPALVSTQHKTSILNVPVYFPYVPYDLQINYMKAVIEAATAKENALLQSPTGTGKTLCLLAAALSYVDNFRESNDQRINIIYCSRTHSQLKQVQNQLQKTCYRPTMCNFGSRDQFCIKQQFAGIKGRDLMQSCSKAVKLYLKSQPRKRLRLDQQSEQEQQWQGQSQSPIDQNEIDNKKKQKSFMCSLCKTQNQYLFLVQKYFSNKIVTSEKIKSQGERLGFCPYYYAFQIKEKADIIFMPYNYILDVSRLPFYESIIKNSIIIFDEAHNVPEAACDGRSYQIHAGIFVNAQLQLNKMSYHPSMSPDLRIVAYQYEDLKQILTREYENLRRNLSSWAQQLYDKQSKLNPYNYGDSQQTQQIYSSTDMKSMIYHWFSPLSYDFNQFTKLPIQKRKQIHSQTIKHLSKITSQTNKLIQALKQTYDGIFQSIQKLNAFINKSMELIQVFQHVSGKEEWENQDYHYRLSIKCNAKETGLNYVVTLVCLTPSLTFSDVLKLQPRSILLTSGTISPLDSWEKQLKLKFNVKLVNKHVIDKSQLHSGIVCKSVDNEFAMNFSYNQLQKNNNIYFGLLKTIIRFCQVIPNGILVIFPSYRIIKTFKDLLSKNVHLLNKLKACKQICFQDKNTSDYVILNFKNKAKSRGAILFCVCRGKVSEGLDFSNQLCRGVIFVGVPYPSVKDPLIQQKRQYYDKLVKITKKSNIIPLSGDEWYTLNTMRAVNQGIGRVIRHINDYGVILLMDNRYQQAKLKNMLPGWTKQSLKSYYKFEDLDQRIIEFFNQMKIKFANTINAYQIQNQQAQYFSQNNPIPPKKYFAKKYGKESGKSRPQKSQKKQNAFQILMRQAKRNSSKEAPKHVNKKKNQMDFL